MADNKPMDLFYRCYKYSFLLRYIEIQIESISFTFKLDNLINVPVTCKYSKLIFIQVDLTYNVYQCVCVSGK